MKHKRLIVITLILCLLLFSACGSSPSGTSNTEDAASSLPDIKTDDSENPADTETAENAMLRIETDYGTLEYPAQYQAQLKTETEQRGEALTVHFRAEISGGVYELFTVTIAPDEGDSIGVIRDADGKERNVFVEVFELDVDSLSPEDRDTLFSMQEGVNDLIDALN